MRIALVSPPMLPVPPPRYAGTERIVAVLARELHRRGHAVTVFAPGDSEVDCELVTTIPRGLWTSEYRSDLVPYMHITLSKVWAQRSRFDVIHSHLDGHGLLFARQSPVPVVSTLHGRLDVDGVPDLLSEFSDVPLVAISDSQRRWSPAANWVATIYHGLPLAGMPFRAWPGSYLAFVGRTAPEKGIEEAVRLARATGLRLRMAAKVLSPVECAEFERVVKPAIADGVVEYLGELGPRERDEVYAGALATLMLGAWPEPFGLVAIESMATGTPVIARRAGALPELIEHHVDGFVVDDTEEGVLAVERAGTLDRATIRGRALSRFSVERMVDEYEVVYRRLAGTPEVGVRRADADLLRVGGITDAPRALGPGVDWRRVTDDVGTVRIAAERRDGRERRHEVGPRDVSPRETAAGGRPAVREVEPLSG